MVEAESARLQTCLSECKAAIGRFLPLNALTSCRNTRVPVPLGQHSFFGPVPHDIRFRWRATRSLSGGLAEQYEVGDAGLRNRVRTEFAQNAGNLTSGI
jgi:hypothetical protein